MKRSNKISEYISSEKNIFSLKWKKIFDLKKISDKYVAQGIVKYKKYLIYSIHEKNKKSFILIFVEKDGELKFVSKQEMDLEATHTSDLTIFEDKLYAIDFHSNFIYEFKIIEKINNLKLVFNRKSKINLEKHKFGSFCIFNKNNKNYLMVTSFLNDNRIWVFDFNDIFDKKLGFDDSLIFETEASYFTQGLFYQKKINKIFYSVNRFGNDFIFKIDVDNFLLKKDINDSIEKVFLAPGKMVEDIYIDNEYIYTSDEGTNKIYKAKLSSQEKISYKRISKIKKNKYYNKLLSHRNRISGFQENTLDGFAYVLNTEIKYIEMDVRLSADNIYFVYHDPYFKDGLKRFRFYDKTLNEIKKERYNKNKIRISELEDILSYFSKNKKKTQILALDLKDFGEEEILINLIEKYNLINFVELYTWTPQIILKLNEIFKKRKISIPIYFSHVRTDSIFRYILIPQFLNWRKYFLSFFDFVLIGNHNYKTPLGKYAKGYRHVPYFFELPEEIINILKKYNGGICVSAKSRKFPRLWINYFEKYKKIGLKTAVFGPFFGELKIDKKEWFENLAKQKEIDIVFMDNLDDILKKDNEI